MWMAAVGAMLLRGEGLAPHEALTAMQGSGGVRGSALGLEPCLTSRPRGEQGPTALKL